MAAKKTSTLEVDGRKVTISNAEKVLYPAGKYTKGEVIDYYIRVSPYLLPHMKDRPVTMKRYPDGVKGEFFFEKDAPAFTPEWVKRTPVPRKAGGDPIQYIVVNDLPTLVWLANLASLELHTFMHRAKKLDQPDAVVFDFDPGEGLDIVASIRVALLVRQVMGDLGLECFPKVSGSRGIHLYVPLHTKVTYDQTRGFANALAKLMAQRHPDLVVSEMAKHLRRGKVFIDWSQNSDFKTTVAPYSLRAKGALPTVSLPLAWEELETALESKDVESLTFTPSKAIERLERVGDLFAPVLSLKQKLPASVEPKKPVAAKKKTSTKKAPASLKKYEEKRNFAKTAEPAPAPVAKLPRRSSQGSMRRFVIQKHAASHLHYDFRLEMEDVLKSWAVPKGPPYEKGVRRLAMATEDHPIGYLDFEGTIPKGQYGGGIVMVWDIGTYQLIDGNYHKGKLNFYLQGKKLKGEWTLVRGREADGRGWYLLKTGDDDFKPLTAKQDDESALTGRTMEQIRNAQDAVWHSNRDLPEMTDLLDATYDFVEPMLAKLVDRLPEGEDWQYEAKLDGYRALGARTAEGEVLLYSRRGNVLNGDFPAIAEALRLLPEGTMVDGEIVALDKQGRPVFNELQNRASTQLPLFYYLFDLLALNGKDVRGLPLRQRREWLEKYALAGKRDPLRVSPVLRAGVDQLVEAAEQQGLEGLVAKRAGGAYESGRRSGAWVKYRTVQSQEMVVGGYKPGSNGFEDLLVGYYDKGKLMFAGKLRNGFVPSKRQGIAARFKALETDQCPFANLPEPASARRGEALTAEAMKKHRWLRPELVVQVGYAEWTKANHLRHSKFLGIREDKSPREVVRETAA